MIETETSLPREKQRITWASALLTGIWALAMLGLPMTSFPGITVFTHSMVAPFSAIPIAVLALVWLVPYLVRRGTLPKETLPFLVLTLWILMVSALAFFQPVDTYRNQSPLSQTVRAFIPFGIGLAFFLITSTWHSDTQQMRRTLQLITIGGAIMLVWSAAQAVVVLEFREQYPPLMAFIKKVLVSQFDSPGSGRIAGLTWEPSWLADQFVMLYLPIWLAATYARTTVFPRLWKISVENILLPIGVGVFSLTSPRIGAVAFLLVVLYVLLRLNVAVYRWVVQRLSQRWSATGHSWLFKAGIGVAVVAVFVGIYLAFSVVAVQYACKHDPARMGRVCSTSTSVAEIVKTVSTFNENTLFDLGQNYAFLERTVFWMTGWHIFNDHPIAGVGLGNAGFYFLSHMPSRGWATIEVRSIAYQNPGLPNIKSLWFRLLAETGIVGFAIFLVWLIGLWRSALTSERSADPTLKTVALAGQLAIVAFVIEGFSTDTFGLPYLFILMGLTAAAGWIYRREVGK